MMHPTVRDPKLTSQTLLLRLKADAPAREMAWREFYETYAQIIGGFARKMGARQQDIADVVQDVMLGFFSVSPEFTYDASRGRFRGYLKTCTWRVIQRRFGRAMRVAGRPLGEVDPSEVQVETAWNDVWEQEKLQRAVESVRQRYSARPDKAITFRAFEMYVMLERSPQEVAAELSISVDSVHQAKTRVSKAIRTAMESISELAD
jgi:RNA polymerase sigma-70 factor (ECF subfamily)